jgi:hypothetical protein
MASNASYHAAQLSGPPKDVGGVVMADARLASTAGRELITGPQNPYGVVAWPPEYQVQPPLDAPVVGALVGADATKLLAPRLSVTVSKYLSLPMARKAMPPEVMPPGGEPAVAVYRTEFSRVVPSLANSLPRIEPLVLQSTSSRYQTFAW